MSSNNMYLRDAKFTWHSSGFMISGFVWDPKKKEKSVYISYAGISCFTPVEQEVFDYLTGTQRCENAISIYTHNGICISASFDEPLASVMEKLIR